VNTVPERTLILPIIFHLYESKHLAVLYIERKDLVYSDCAKAPSTHLTMLSTVVATLLLSVATSAQLLYAGINESGGEFGVYSATATKGTGLPGTFGVDYRFINEVSVVR
jgi:hypothetical protein